MNAIYDEIARFNAGRDPDLLKRKYKLMAESEFAFFRGTDHLFARIWPDLKPTEVGPSVLICGDLHLENFGAFRGDDGTFSFDINDFDEAIVGPCSFDVVRCAASTLLAAEAWQLSPLLATSILWTYLDKYRSAVLDSLRTGNIGSITEESAKGPIRDLLSATSFGSQEELLDKHTEKRDGKRHIERSDDKHPDVNKKTYRLVKEAVETYGHTKDDRDSYEVLDVSGRVAGIGSLGVPRYTVLIAGGGRSSQNRLLDLKEERASSVLNCGETIQPDFGGNEAQRVIEAQRHMQAHPAAGLATVAIDGQWFRMREMIPDENRSGLNQLVHKPEKLRRAVQIAGKLTAWAHLRGSHLRKLDRASALGEWVEGPGLEATLASAIRFANQIKIDFDEFVQSIK